MYVICRRFYICMHQKTLASKHRDYIFIIFLFCVKSRLLLPLFSCQKMCIYMCAVRTVYVFVSHIPQLLVLISLLFPSIDHHHHHHHSFRNPSTFLTSLTLHCLTLSISSTRVDYTN